MRARRGFFRTQNSDFVALSILLGLGRISHGHPLGTIGSPLTSLFSEKCLKKQLLEYVTLLIPLFIDF